MPRYCFRDLLSKQSNKIHQSYNYNILLDGLNYTETGEYREVKKIQFTSKNGIIIIDGLFDLSNKDITNLIKLNFLSIYFSKELISSYKLRFDQPKISVVFYLSQDTIDIIKKNINILKQKYKNFDTDYKTRISFSLSKFSNADILSYLKGEGKIGIIQEEEEKNNRYKSDINIINNIEENNIINKSNVNIISNIGEQKIKEEEEEEKDKGEEEEDVLMNPFISFVKKVEKEEEVKKEEKIIIKQNEYIKIKDMNTFKFPSNINIKNKTIYKYLQKNIKKLNEKIKNNNLFSININNSFPIIETGEKNNQIIQLKNISFNEELEDLKADYEKDIILNFINILIGNNFNNLDGDMTINDYTNIVISFIKNIQKRIIELKKQNINNDKKYNYYIQRLEKIISSLKLFHILFLNCFILSDNKNANIINNNELFDEYSSPQVQTMRKKLLIEWCIAEEKAYIKKYDLNNINKAIKRNLLTKQIISFGQIKTAINSNNPKNLFINAKLSNLSKDNTNNTFSYFIQTQKKNNDISNTFISYEPYTNDDKIKNSWISFFLQSLLYIEKSNEYIIKSIKLIDEKIEYMNDFSKPYLSKKNKDDINVLHLNYLLLKIYEKLLDNDGIKDIKDIENYINMLSNNNLFNTTNSDHFIQYIILFLFTKIINIIVPDLSNYNKLIKKHYSLLIQIISEILSDNENNKIDNNKNNIYNLILIIKLLHSSNINKKLKRKIFIDIISHQNLENIEKLWEEYNKNNNELINEEMQEYINGIYYMNTCNWFKAYKCFLKSKNYDCCLNSYINHCFYLLKEKNIKEINFQEIYDNLNEIQNEAPHLFIDYYEDFYQVICFIVNKNETYYENIIELLKKYIYEYSEDGKVKNIDEENHRIIIKLLYQVILWKDRESEDKDELILGGDEGIIKLNNVFFEDKVGFFNDVLKDIIDYKNIQFSFN